MKKRQESKQGLINLDCLISDLRAKFNSIKDHRGANSKFSLTDLLMSGFAMFQLKYPSLLQFETQSKCEADNLRTLYGVKELCTDAQLRNVLDQVDPEPIRDYFADYYERLKSLGVVDQYGGFYKGYKIIAIDGVEHFSSKEVHCSHCQERRQQNGSVTYSHSMLCAALVCPNCPEVFPLTIEPITKQDGEVKNDCERNAAVRLMNYMSNNYKNEKFIIAGDALYANAPYVRQIKANNWEYVLNVKPDGHKTLFAGFESRRLNGVLSHTSYPDQKGGRYSFWWAKNLPLCNAAPDVRVNMLWCEREDKNGNVTRFTWITSLPLNKNNIHKIMMIGRSRWKIENETFNTLKNQGYNFEHNYGHGFKHLSTILAYLMLMAFLIDQIHQKCSKDFQKLWKTVGTKAKLWNTVRALFSTHYLDSFKELFSRMTELFPTKIQT